jgi:hypothetical protein
VHCLLCDVCCVLCAVWCVLYPVWCSGVWFAVFWYCGVDVVLRVVCCVLSVFCLLRDIMLRTFFLFGVIMNY